MIASANHDERQFTDPDRLDITRELRPHLAFGLGIHYWRLTPDPHLPS